MPGSPFPSSTVRQDDRRQGCLEPHLAVPRRACDRSEACPLMIMARLPLLDGWLHKGMQCLVLALPRCRCTNEKLLSFATSPSNINNNNNNNNYKLCSTL